MTARMRCVFILGGLLAGKPASVGHGRKAPETDAGAPLCLVMRMPSHLSARTACAYLRARAENLEPGELRKLALAMADTLGIPVLVGGDWCGTPRPADSLVFFRGVCFVRGADTARDLLREALAPPAAFCPTPAPAGPRRMPTTSLSQAQV